MEPNKAELDSIRNSPVEVKKIRTRLSDVSWWMRILCQKIGTRVDGPFGRYQALCVLALERVGIELTEWQKLTKDFGRMFSQVAGKVKTVSVMRSLKTGRRFNLKRMQT